MIDISIEMNHEQSSETYSGDSLQERMHEETIKEKRMEAAKDSLLRIYRNENEKLRKIIIAQAVKIFELGGYEPKSDTGGYE